MDREWIGEGGDKYLRQLEKTNGSRNRTNIGMEQEKRRGRRIEDGLRGKLELDSLLVIIF